MPKRLLVLGETRAARLTLEATERLGYESAHFKIAADTDEIVRAASEWGVDGVVACDEQLSAAAAGATNELGLPGFTQEACDCSRTSFLTDYLHARKIETTPRVISSEWDVIAETTAEWRMPVLVYADGASPARDAVAAHHREDLLLAFNKARKIRESGLCAIERPRFGSVHVVGVFTPEQFEIHGAFICEEPDGPVQFAAAYRAMDPNETRYRPAVMLAEKALTGNGFGAGVVEVTVDVTKMAVREIALGPAGDVPWLATDLLGTGFTENVVRTALGEPLARATTPISFSAVRWIPANPGVVSGVSGLAKIPFPEEECFAEIHVKRGDVLRHTDTGRARDRIGYVIAVDDRPYKANDKALQAARTIRVETSAIVEE